MPILNVVTRDGASLSLKSTAGLSVMEVIRDAGVDEMLALYGACCSCATCHVHIDEGFLQHLTSMNGDEDDLLDSFSDRDHAFRLSCQLVFIDDLDGMTVRIAAED